MRCTLVCVQPLRIHDVCLRPDRIHGACLIPKHMHLQMLLCLCPRCSLPNPRCRPPPQSSRGRSPTATPYSWWNSGKPLLSAASLRWQVRGMGSPNVAVKPLLHWCLFPALPLLLCLHIASLRRGCSRQGQSTKSGSLLCRYTAPPRRGCSRQGQMTWSGSKVQSWH